MVRAWYMDESIEDQRLERHRTPPEFLDLEQLKELTGVLHYNINPETYEADGVLAYIREERGYTYAEIVEGSEEDLPIREQWMKTFFSEHQRTREEMRFVIEGSGYYDVRNGPDADWIRIEAVAGDLIVLPARIYRRFTFDKKDYAKVLRLYIGEPSWPLSHIPYCEGDIIDSVDTANSTEKNPSSGSDARRDSVKSIGSGVTVLTSELKKTHSLVQGREGSLAKLEDNAEKMAHDAENFASVSHQLMLKYKDKKWYQF